MDSLESLRSQVTILEIERTWIKQQPFVVGCWAVKYKPRGSARTENVYWQLRSNEPMFNGRRTKHLKSGEVAEFQTQIARGRRLRQLSRQVTALQKRIGQVERRVST